MTELSIDVSQLKPLARDLRRAEPLLAKNFLTSLGKAGDVVAQSARQKADFSTRIPGTVKVRRRGVAVRVQAGGNLAPGAAAIDNRGRTGTFRHPVFGNRNVWVSQQAHPFLEPARDEHLGDLEQLVLNAVDQAFVSAGWHG